MYNSIWYFLTLLPFNIYSLIFKLYIILIWYFLKELVLRFSNVSYIFKIMYLKLKCKKCFDLVPSYSLHLHLVEKECFNSDKNNITVYQRIIHYLIPTNDHLDALCEFSTLHGLIFQKKRILPSNFDYVLFI